MLYNVRPCPDTDGSLQHDHPSYQTEQPYLHLPPRGKVLFLQEAPASCHCPHHDRRERRNGHGKCTHTCIHLLHNKAPEISLLQCEELSERSPPDHRHRCPLHPYGQEYQKTSHCLHRLWKAVPVYMEDGPGCNGTARSWTEFLLPYFLLPLRT